MPDVDNSMIDPRLRDQPPPLTPRRAMLQSIEDSPLRPFVSPSPSQSVLGRRQRSPSPNPFLPSTATHPVPAFNALAFAKGLVANKKVKTEHSAELYDYANMTPAQREIAMFGLMLDIRGEISKEKQAAVHAWTMDKALRDTIRDYTLAILMAPVVAAYQLDAGIVTKLLVSKGIYPAEWELVSPRISAIRKYIGDTASDKRYEIKSKIGDSIEKSECLSLLCKRILNGTKLRVTPAFRGRIAIIRHQYKWNPDERGGQFWTFIDNKLKELRERVNNDAVRLAKATLKYVEEDEKLYTAGADKTYELITDNSALPPLQLAAETALAARVPVVQPSSGSAAAPAS